ncbi:TPA: hypothetical protein HA241_05855, partial [Candidatus Woesearchaeota archaeon]|nr:hypothetical protein [Candidatus Woesearchaeota archaeon]
MSNGDRRELSIEQQRYRFFRRVAYDTVIASLLISCGAEATQILLSNTATPSPTSPTPDTPKPAEIPATQFTREGDAIVVDVQDIATYEGLEAYLIKIGIYLTTPKEGWTQQALPSAVGVERHVLIASDENGTHQSDFLVVTTYDSVNKKARISFGKPEDQQAWTSATLDQNAPMLVGYSPEAKTALLKLLFKDGNFLTIGRALQTVFPDGQGSLSPLSGQDFGHANIGAVFSPVLGTPEPGPDGSVTIRIGPQYVVLFADLDAPTGPKFVEVSFSPPSQEDAYQASLNQASTELGEAIVRIETDDSGMARAYLTETPQPGELPFGVFVEGKWMWYKQYKLNQQAGDLGLQPGQYVFHLGDGASMSERLDTAVVMDNKGEVIADIKWD